MAKKILFLTTVLPSNNQRGGEVASKSFIDVLVEQGFDLEVIGYLRKGDLREGLSYSVTIVDERPIETLKSKYSMLKWLLFSFYKKIPYSAAKYWSRSYINLVRNKIRERDFDLLVIDHAQMAWIWKYVKDIPDFIFISHNVENRIYQGNQDQARNVFSKWLYSRESKLIREVEESFARKAAQVWVFTEEDANYYSQVKETQGVKVFSLMPSFSGFTYNSFEKSKEFDIALIGTWLWKANSDSLKWFLDKVYPNLPKDIRIHVAGPDGETLLKGYPDIFYRGYVPSAKEFMAQARVIAIPTLHGSGIQVKTLEAITSCSQIVATPVAMRGIKELPSTVQVAETPDLFATYLVEAIYKSFNEGEMNSEIENWYSNRRLQFSKSIAVAIEDLN